MEQDTQPSNEESQYPDARCRNTLSPSDRLTEGNHPSDCGVNDDRNEENGYNDDTLGGEYQIIDLPSEGAKNPFSTCKNRVYIIEYLKLAKNKVFYQVRKAEQKQDDRRGDMTVYSIFDCCKDQVQSCRGYNCKKQYIQLGVEAKAAACHQSEDEFIEKKKNKGNDQKNG